MSPETVVETITEEKRFFIDELRDALSGLRPSPWVLAPQVVETSWRPAMAGHVILAGRGATVITARLPNVLHIRLTGPLPRRSECAHRLRNLTPATAARYANQEERGRERHVQAHFRSQPVNELLCDPMINTDRISDEDPAAILAGSARRCFANSQTSNPRTRHIAMGVLTGAKSLKD